MLGEDDEEQQSVQEEAPKTAAWTSKHFERPDESQIKLKRYSYSKGVFQPEHGPYAIATAFQNAGHETLNAICAEIASVLKEDEEKMRNYYSPRTLVCAIIPSSQFEFVEALKKQGNIYQYELMGKYTLVTKVLWHGTRDLMILEQNIMEMLRANSVAFAYVNYLHQDNLGEQF